MESVLYEISGSVATLTLNDPQKHNSLNESMQLGLMDALRKAGTAPGVSVVLLAAKGPSFCAGGDLRLMQTYRDSPVEDVCNGASRSADLFKLLADFEKPIVAAVSGPAYGGGFGLVCASSIVVAAESALFGCTELKLGLFPFVILPLLRQAIGDRKALEIALMATAFDARYAKDELGLVNHVVPAEEVGRKAAEIANHIGTFSPMALRMGMRGFRSTSGLPAKQAIDSLLSLRVIVSKGEDLHEGATAFLEKRKPVWGKGR